MRELTPAEFKTATIDDLLDLHTWNSIVRMMQKQALLEDRDPVAGRKWFQNRTGVALPKWSVFGVSGANKQVEPIENNVTAFPKALPGIYFTNDTMELVANTSGWMRPVEFDEPVRLRYDAANAPVPGSPCGVDPELSVVSVRFAGFVCLAIDTVETNICWVIQASNQKYVGQVTTQINAFAPTQLSVGSVLIYLKYGTNKLVASNYTLAQVATLCEENLAIGTWVEVLPIAGVGFCAKKVCGGGGSSPTEPELSVDDVTVEEGTDTYAVFPVSLSSVAIDDVTISFATTDGSATQPGDYTTALEVSTTSESAGFVAGTSVTILAGSMNAWVRVPIVDDGAVESDEQFTLTGTVTAGTTTNANNTGTCTITDDDSSGPINPGCPGGGGSIPAILNVGIQVGSGTEELKLGSMIYQGTPGGNHTWEGSWNPDTAEYSPDTDCLVLFPPNVIGVDFVRMYCTFVTGWQCDTDAYSVDTANPGSKGILWTQANLTQQSIPGDPFEVTFLFQAQTGCFVTVRVYE